MNEKGIKFKIRGIQLDLARHFEPVDYVLSFIDFAAECGFNTLVLYLEGRILTRSFSHSGVRHTYSPKEMSKVVAHASRKRMTVVPVVPALAHAEQMLQTKGLAHLSEEREGNGRFGHGSPSTFCISQEETYSFICKYYAEIAEIFPDVNFHAGLDEGWNFGYCPLCRKRWQREGLGKMFVGHIRQIRDILGSIGRRMWMWDDMLEIFPEELVNIPNDVVMCHWSYDDRIEEDGTQGHFMNRFRKDWLDEYDKLGFESVFCPWNKNGSFDNIESITKYASSHKVAGGLLTQWGISPRFYHEQSVAMYFTGKLWKGFSNGKAWDLTLERFCGGADPIIKNSFKTLVSIKKKKIEPKIQNYLMGSMYRDELLEEALTKNALDTFSEKQKTLPDKEEMRFDLLAWTAEMDLVFWSLRKIISEICTPTRNLSMTSSLRDRLSEIALENGRLHKRLMSSLKRWNFDISPDDKKILKEYDNAEKLIDALALKLKILPCRTDWICIARLYLQDYHGAPSLNIAAASGDREVTVCRGCFKPYTIAESRTGGHYDFYFPFRCKQPPSILRIEGGGYGGQGISFIELRNKDYVLKPISIKSIKGPVTNSNAVLLDDSSFAMLGRTDIRTQFLKPELANKKGVLEIELA